MHIPDLVLEASQVRAEHADRFSALLASVRAGTTATMWGADDAAHYPPGPFRPGLDALRADRLTDDEPGAPRRRYEVDAAGRPLIVWEDDTASSPSSCWIAVGDHAACRFLLRARAPEVRDVVGERFRLDDRGRMVELASFRSEDGWRLEQFTFDGDATVPHRMRARFATDIRPEPFDETHDITWSRDGRTARLTVVR